MISNRDELTADMLAKQLVSTRVGIILRGLSGIDPGLIATKVSIKLDHPLHVAYVGDYSTSTEGQNIVLANNIESAVAWRNQPELAGQIIVFIQNESRKSHSLNEFDELTARDLAQHLINVAETQLTVNEPQTQFWAALREETANFPLPMIEDFVREVNGQQENPQAIIDNLWRIGLLRDNAILDRGQNVTVRIQHNRELIEKMGQLSEQSRRRIGSVLAKVRGDDAEPLRQAFASIKEFYFRGRVEILGQLDVATVEQLLEAGRPMPAVAHSKPIDEEAEKDTPLIEEEQIKEDDADYDIIKPDKPLKGKALQKEISQLAIDGNDEAQKGLRELGEFLKRQLRNSQEVEEEYTPTSGFGGQTLQPTIPSDKLRQFIGYVCVSDSWGGILATTRRGLKEAIFDATPEDVTPYNPDDSKQGQAGQCLFSLLRGFDVDLPDSLTFSEPLNRLVETRKKLLEELDLLLNFPIVLFGGYPEARQILNEYLDAYSDLLRIFRDNEALLHRQDALATSFIASELIRLDTVYLVNSLNADDPQWKAMLTPLHPLHLWRFREIFNAIHIGQRKLAEDEQQQLTNALPNLPHLLHYLILSQNVTVDTTILPQAGSIENLPTYENHTNRYLGDDGIDFVQDLLKRWLEYAPYSRPQIRLGLVDAPNLYFALRSAAEFLKTKRKTRVVIHSYYTHEQNYRSELAQLDFDDRDHDLAELMRSKRLTIHLHEEQSIQHVITILQKQPVHILYMFDQSQYQVEFGPRARQLLVSPLVITYDYTYNKKFKRGSIAPSSEAEEGVFSYYHFLVERAANLPAGKQIRMQYNPEAELTPINNLLQTDATRWLVIADRVLTNYSPQNAVPMGEKRNNRREIGVWSKVSDQAIKRFIDLLRRFNLRPDKNTVTELLQRYGHIATEGVISLAMIGGTASREASQKGLLGKLLAAKWYTNRYPGALIASLDSNLAQQWLQGRPHGNERADLVGLRIADGRLIVEPIEVKTRAGSAEVRIEQDPTTGRSRLAGRAVEQLQSVIEALEPIFGQGEIQPLFTPARREVLRYQLHRECFHEVHNSAWQATWYERLSQAFVQPYPNIPVECRGLILHIRLEEGDDETVNEYRDQLLTLARLGSTAVQQLVASPISNKASFALVDEGEMESMKLPKLPETSSKPVKITSKIEETKKVRIAEPSPKPIPPSISEVTQEMAAKEDEPQIESSQLEPIVPEQAEAEELARLFLRAGRSYRIQIDECDPERAIAGPNVWRFYVRLSRGQRLDPLRNVLEDIGREMARSGLLVSTIPNSDEITLDVPRLGSDRKIVPIDQGLNQLPAVISPENMPILIGATPEGEDIIRDLGKMPHLMVGGTTGAGKTIFLYGLLVSLLKTHPDPATLRLFVSTSKPEDFIFFNALPHLETEEVIADAEQAVDLLQSYLTQAFEERLTILTDARCRDIGEYNTRHQPPLPPLVIIVDEFADLADQLAYDRAGQRAFYTQLRRVAQLGRNRGIHLVLCTQRPSADLVPTNIRNLMNVRVALRVNDSTASKMILDELGAEQLQMHGDLLFKEHTKLTRAQGYYVPSKALSRLLQS